MSSLAEASAAVFCLVGRTGDEGRKILRLLDAQVNPGFIFMSLGLPTPVLTPVRAPRVGHRTCLHEREAL
jgi:hypothetical protein